MSDQFHIVDQNCLRILYSLFSIGSHRCRINEILDLFEAVGQEAVREETLLPVSIFRTFNFNLLKV